MTVAAAALFLSLGLDTFAVAVSLGVKGTPRQKWIRIGLTFGLFEGLMPLVGLLIGRQASVFLGNAATYVAGAILIGLGAWELREAFSDEKGRAPAGASIGGRSLWLAGLSVSLDELAIGFSLGMFHVNLGLALLYIAVQAFVITFLGLRIGAHASARLAERSELAAALLLIALGIAIVVAEALGAGIA